MLFAPDLLQQARTSSGLNDYGDMAFAEGLQVLVDAINAEAHLTPANEARYRAELLRLLENRLRMQSELVAHPEILDEEILPPVFITSLPRTGSTKLHRMLGASGDFNAMKFWQAYHFARFANDAPASGPDPRIAATESYLRELRQWAPQYMESHPMYAEETEEEHILLDAGFNSLYQHAAFLNVPSYIGWVMTLDRHAMFEDLRRMLQYLQWQHHRGTKRRWILKTPGLLGTEATLAEVFPGTDFIVTHRHPVQTMASTAALFAGTLEMYNEVVDKRMAGEVMLASFGVTMQRHLEWRAAYPAEKVRDVRFGDVVDHEFDVLTSLYDFLGIAFTERSRANVRAWLAMDAERHDTPRKFTLAEFGLDEAKVNATFAGYLARYRDYL